jgi:hypothetical protein
MGCSDAGVSAAGKVESSRRSGAGTFAIAVLDELMNEERKYDQTLLVYGEVGKIHGM